jgi:hypothetical protein
MRGVSQHRLSHALRVPLTLDARGECAGNRADRAFHAIGEERGQDVGQAIGVGEPLRLEPIGQVHGLLHRPSVERAVWQPVDGEHVQVVRAQKGAQLLERFGLTQRLRRLGRQPQADAERHAGREPFPDRNEVAHEILPHLCPALAGMDVGAVREVRCGGGGHGRAGGVG